jgi:hypothetical protein
MDVAIRIDHFIHREEPDKLDLILLQLSDIRQQQGVIMAKIDELNAELVAINASTNELAADVDALLAQNLNGLSPAEADSVKAQLTAIKDSLQATAAKYTPPV